MQSFVVHANIDRFCGRLKTAENDPQREAILRLLEEEIAKLPPDEQELARKAAATAAAQSTADPGRGG